MSISVKSEPRPSHWGNHKAFKVCPVCKGTGWNHGAQFGQSKPGYKTVECRFCDYWSKPK